MGAGTPDPTSSVFPDRPNPSGFYFHVWYLYLMVSSCKDLLIFFTRVILVGLSEKGFGFNVYLLV